MTTAPSVRYRSIVADSARFDGFEFRDGDIIVSTPPKCGTTWTQTILALLIFGTPDLPAPVDLLSPWLEQSLRPLDSVVADLAAQTHRRFIKSHTPFDGLPDDDRVTYVCVGRDPRDVALSWDNHVANVNFERFFELRGNAVGNDDLMEVLPPGGLPAPLPEEVDRFWQWVDDATPVEMNTTGLLFTMKHLGSFYAERSRPNVVMLHYGDLKDDLSGQMQALAQRLSINVDDAGFDALVQAATFESMKSHAAAVGPNQTELIWNDRERFFNSGTSGQWQRLGLGPDDVARYAARVREVADDELSAWAHRGPIA